MCAAEGTSYCYLLDKDVDFMQNQTLSVCEQKKLALQREWFSYSCDGFLFQYGFGWIIFFYVITFSIACSPFHRFLRRYAGLDTWFFFNIIIEKLIFWIISLGKPQLRYNTSRSRCYWHQNTRHVGMLRSVMDDLEHLCHTTIKAPRNSSPHE